jgi:hypothetical protein
MSSLSELKGLVENKVGLNERAVRHLLHEIDLLRVYTVNPPRDRQIPLISQGLGLRRYGSEPGSSARTEAELGLAVGDSLQDFESDKMEPPENPPK